MSLTKLKLIHPKWQTGIQIQSLIIILILTNSIETLKPAKHPKPDGREYKSDDNSFEKIIEFLTKLKNIKGNRRVNVVDLEMAKTILKRLVQHMPIKKPSSLRNAENDLNIAAEPGMNKEQAEIVEAELNEVRNKQSSALLDKPYIEKQGKDDFLVMNPDVVDPFVTAIPNAIYYNIEKKCVNWLDDCSLQGIRARLLQKERSPFK